MTLPIPNSSASDRRSWTAEIGSLLALVISIVALGVTAYQTRLMQQQARASVWPYIKIGYRVSDRGDNAGVAITVSNNGVGPAKIESVKVTLDGKPIFRWNELFSAMQLEMDPKQFSEAYLQGQVQPPSDNRDTTIEPIAVSQGDLSVKLAAAMPRIGLAICYCSVYDECWTAHFHERTVQPTAACPADGKDEFLQ